MSAAVSFTFDDGPDAVWTRRVCAELERLGVQATFFLVGERVERHAEVVRGLLGAGHTVELHCHRHVRHTELDEAEIRLDTERALHALVAAGASPMLWRAPWGVTTAASERVARSFDLELVGWACDTHDWRGDAPEQMLAETRPRLLGRGGSVLMHDALGPGSRRAGCENTIALLGKLTDAVREHGLPLEPLRATAEPVARR